MFEYDENAKRAAEKLDEYNFSKILHLCYDNDIRDPWDMMEKFVEEYEELEDVLDNLSWDEFMEYLSEVYTVEFREVITYKMYWT